MKEKISDKLNIISSAKDDIKTAIENKGVDVGYVGIQEYASKIDELKIATPPTKGIIINEFDSEGYVTDVSVVGMTSIPNMAFCSTSVSFAHLFNKKLKKVHLSDDVTSIGLQAFRYCDVLETINLHDNITYMDSYVFNGCRGLKELKFPMNLTALNNNMCDGCTNLEKVTLPNTKLKQILTSVFYNCSKLTEIDIPSMTITIGSNCFQNCTSLVKVIIRNTTPPSISTSTFTSTPIKSGTGYIYVPDESVEAYQTATNWSTYASQIKGISELGD